MVSVHAVRTFVRMMNTTVAVEMNACGRFAAVEAQMQMRTADPHRYDEDAEQAERNLGFGTYPRHVASITVGRRNIKAAMSNRSHFCANAYRIKTTRRNNWHRNYIRLRTYPLDSDVAAAKERVPSRAKRLAVLRTSRYPQICPQTTRPTRRRW